ncbi:MerR family transcriptional regulator [Nocardia thailandica]|uniref:MerR family transcriptional regulator n=1 Tax=Nocardia thailandica TaxID=257275 RepID=A0ABW6PMF7_9NOCA|nr:MerR family transcriptional regulator [Nocardia thailandica]
MPRYTRAQLAELSGVAARTIRYYHSFGVLPRPLRAGKEVVYGDEHLDRLQDIGRMQARGLRLEAIREVFDSGTGVSTDWRALFDPRAAPGEERDSLLDDDRIAALLGERAEVLDDLVAAGYLERRPDGWYVPDLPMLKGALVLYDVGTDVALSSRLRALIRERMSGLAVDLVQTFREGADRSYGGGDVDEDLNRFLEPLRAVCWEVGGATLADEITRAAHAARAADGAR